MEKLVINKVILSCFLYVFLALHFSPAASQEVEDTREFAYESWSMRGPARWGMIRPEWRMCSNGTMQSPIELLDQRVRLVSSLGRLKSRYIPSNATLRNRGHDMMLKWTSNTAGFVELNRTRYYLQQSHWHSPSEHTMNGKRFDLELHLVHQSLTGQLAVIGIMYQIGAADSFLTSMEGHLMHAISNRTYQERSVGVVDPSLIKFGSRRYYKYIGSLTVPPCTQNVIWLVVREVRTVARGQVSLLHVAVNDGSDTNARPIQHVHGRTLELYTNEDVIYRRN
ncbi:alpha carbonic anhydrase 7-like [Humulus lupulus]|uniref:alpha carbonic anhydrase 7-like n=1 Tax=Humulus lupulus TaxID=3486 RepID=UPI002B409D10|nr:alpha carbonic anhydrase 7-like [Humulus lupulus]